MSSEGILGAKRVPGASGPFALLRWPRASTVNGDDRWGQAALYEDFIGLSTMPLT